MAVPKRMGSGPITCLATQDQPGPGSLSLAQPTRQWLSLKVGGEGGRVCLPCVGRRDPTGQSQSSSTRGPGPEIGMEQEVARWEDCSPQSIQPMGFPYHELRLSWHACLLGSPPHHPDSIPSAQLGRVRGASSSQSKTKIPHDPVPCIRNVHVISPRYFGDTVLLFRPLTKQGQSETCPYCGCWKQANKQMG